MKAPREGKKFMWGGSANRGYYYPTEEDAEDAVRYQNSLWKQSGEVEKFEVDADADVFAGM